jgi:glycosyltransferase involved in cell wall biosynthesis
MERLLSRFTARAIAISEYAKDFLVAKKGMPEQRISVIPNGIPLARFRSVNPELGIRKRQELGISGDTKVVAIVGMLHENKGHRYFIEAASRVCPKEPGTLFVIVGDGEERLRLEQQVARLGLEDSVRFLGHRNNIPEILSLVDIFVVASISETGGLSLIEAMAARKPVVVSDSGGPSEIVQDGVTGFIVPVRDPTALASRIEYLIEHPDIAEKLAGKAQEESGKYEIEFTVQRIQHVYEDVLAGSWVRLKPKSNKKISNHLRFRGRNLA